MRRPPVLLILISVLAGIGIMQMTLMIGATAYRSALWGRQISEVRDEVNRLRRDVRILEQVRAHADDPEYLRSLARCLGFVGTDEQVIVDQKAPHQPNPAECRAPALTGEPRAP
ncbi:hypothetical protein HNR42_002239 [Deinobacterium chartae]|uniref:Cell division protein FtsB n=1 Tax=Deinobacterium chartae TaxID=521158 RepID=A0A841I1E0_9DEIO|nr:hypothetical protein [Deinobacterium chartae]